MELKVRIARTKEEKNPLPLPQYKTEGAAGMDLYANLSSDYRLTAGGKFLCPTGLKIEIPSGYEGQIRPRSGLALNHGVTVINSPGTIDSDYRGEVGVLLVNMSSMDHLIRRGDRIAQLVVCPVTRVQLVEVTEAELATTERGTGGFGSTGASDVG
jgi:dUTP pyrophosphatase